MASNSEISRATNVKDFESLITSTTVIGKYQNPSKDSIKFSALQILLASLKTSLNEVDTIQCIYILQCSKNKLCLNF